MLRYILVLWFATLTAGTAPAQSPSPDSTRSLSMIVLYDIRISLADAGSFITIPLHLSGRDWLYGIGAAGISAGLMTSDPSVARWINDNPSSALVHGWDVALKYGNAGYATVFAATSYAAGLLTGADDVRVTGRLLTESLLFSGAVVLVGRYAAGRTRPFLTDDAWEFKGFQRDFRSQSFPSGHAAVAFTVSTVVAERLDNAWVRISLYGLAAAVSYAQVYNQQHWFSDVVVGGVIGVSSSLFVLARERERVNPVHSTFQRWGLTPTLSGLRLQYDLR